MNKALCVPLVVCLSVVLPATAAAQAWPGGRGSVPAQQRNDYLAFVREGVDEMVRTFESAANERDATKVAKLYTEAATVVTPAATVLGRELVRDRFVRALPRMRAVKLRIETFAATGELAHVGGRLSYEVTHANGAHAYDVPVSLVLEVHRQSSWRIRTQVGGELPVLVTAIGETPSDIAPGSPTTIGVQVTDATGNPVPDILVAFELESGAATLSPSVVSTNAKGVAATTVAIGSADRRVVVRATASALMGEPVRFMMPPALADGKEGAKGSASPGAGTGDQ